MRVEIRLLRDVADLPLVRDRILGQRAAVERDRPGARLEQADDDVDGGALAGAVGAEIADDLAALQLKADLVERQQAAVPLRQPSRFEHGVSARWRRNSGRENQNVNRIVATMTSRTTPVSSDERHQIAVVGGGRHRRTGACGSTLAATLAAASAAAIEHTQQHRQPGAQPLTTIVLARSAPMPAHSISRGARPAPRLLASPR